MPDTQQTSTIKRTQSPAWLMFTGDETDENVRAIFLRKYGVEPAQVMRRGRHVLAGPVPEP